MQVCYNVSNKNIGGNDMRGKHILKCCIILLAICLLIPGALRVCRWAEANYRENTFHYTGMTWAEYTVKAFAEENGISYAAYPRSMIELLDRNPETEDFVLAYPFEYGKTYEVDMREYESCASVPLFMQWDQRWGYIPYGSDVAGLTGCGPVCLSMAAYYVTGDERMSPDRMIRFAKENGYCVYGNGSSWTLISEGGRRLGLDVTELPLDQNRIFANLEVQNPIICVMGPGDFTDSGHFIVMTGIEDGLIRINDPNSYANSEKLWDYEKIKDQIRNLWAICAP